MKEHLKGFGDVGNKDDEFGASNWPKKPIADALLTITRSVQLFTGTIKF